MKTALFESDYAPGTFLRIVQTDDGDIIFNCGMLKFDISAMTEEEVFEGHCVGCPCGEGLECNREDGCENYETEIT